jgi:hypothetical protein
MTRAVRARLLAHHSATRKQTAARGLKAARSRVVASYRKDLKKERFGITNSPARTESRQE